MRTDTKQALATCARLMLWTVAFGVIQSLAFKTWRTYHPGWVEPDYAEGFAAAIAAVLVYAQVLNFELRRSGEHWPDLGGWMIPPMRLAGAFGLMTLGTAIIGSELGNLFAAVWSVPDALHAVFDRLLANPFAAVGVAVIVAPVTEELFFRGLILRRLLLTSPPSRAIVLSALLFAGLHVNPWQVAGTLTMGLIFGWVYHRTRSLALCMAGHALNNLIVVCGQHGFIPSIPGFTVPPRGSLVEFQPWWLNLLGLLLFVTGAKAFDRLAPRPESKSPPILESPLPVGP